MTLAKRKPPTREQQSYQDAARALGCVVCTYRRCAQAGPTEIHHRNLGDFHGQKQLGQDAVVALCAWHHRGVPLPHYSMHQMRDEFGPSFAWNPRDFREWTYDVLPRLGRGTEAWQAFQDQLLGVA